MIFKAMKFDKKILGTTNNGEKNSRTEIFEVAKAQYKKIHLLFIDG